MELFASLRLPVPTRQAGAEIGQKDHFRVETI
jgi:hypothetical protein